MSRRGLCAALAIAAMVALDQWLKHWTVQNLRGLHEPKPLIPGLIRLTYAENRGAAFGMLQNMRTFFLILTVLVLSLIVIALFSGKIRSALGFWALTLVAGGALGNFIDRARAGFVVDMFELEFMTFAIFNLADAFLSIGGVMVCLYLLFLHEKEKQLDHDSGV